MLIAFLLIFVRVCQSLNFESLLFIFWKNKIFRFKFSIIQITFYFKLVSSISSFFSFILVRVFISSKNKNRLSSLQILLAVYKHWFKEKYFFFTIPNFNLFELIELMNIHVLNGRNVSLIVSSKKHKKNVLDKNTIAIVSLLI